MKYELSKKFILEAYEAACSDWKERIRKEVPELFNAKLEVGKWYKDSDGEISWIVKYKDIINYRIDVQIFDNGHYYDKGEEIPYFPTLATKEEVEAILWKEANKRGLFEDTKIEDSMNGNNALLNCYSFIVIYYFTTDKLWNKNGCIYSNGKWATPLDENKEIKNKIESLQKEIDELKSKLK